MPLNKEYGDSDRNSLSEQLDEEIRLLLEALNSNVPPSYGKIVRFEYIEGVGIYPTPLNQDNKAVYICFTQENDNIHVFADYARKNDYIEYACQGELDSIVHPHIFARDEWMNENYDHKGTDIREWETTNFDKEWLKKQCIDYYEEMEEANDFGGLFKLKITFDCGKEFSAEGFSCDNKKLDDLLNGLFTNYDMIRLLATWGFNVEDVLTSDHIEAEWKKAKQAPLPLVCFWVDGKKMLPVQEGAESCGGNLKVEFADFVVRTNAFYCNKNHSIESISAYVSVLRQDGVVVGESIPAGYCRSCNCYFILDQDFISLQEKGILLCQLLTYEEYWEKGMQIIRGEELKSQSVLRRCGYTVNANDALSIEQRQGILALVVDNNLYSTTELCGFLDWLISFHGKKRNKNMNAAIEKWKTDRSFIAQYKTENKRKIGVKSIKTKGA